MAWSSFAHLPTTEDEYYYILSNLRNGMSSQDVDTVIATYKGKDKVQHHYRSNLARIGIFKIKNNCIILNYDVKKLTNNREFLKDILIKVFLENTSIEIIDIIESILAVQSYDLRMILDGLENKYPLIDRSSFTRWIRPIVSSLKIIDILSRRPEKITQYVFFLQESYLKMENNFNHILPLELLEKELKKIDESFNIATILDIILECFNFRLKIELLMLPNWATKNKSYKIGQDSYTHIKVKANLLKEDEHEKNNTK